jgi:hypothetical protein
MACEQQVVVAVKLLDVKAVFKLDLEPSALVVKQ